MSSDYIKQLEETIELLKRKFEDYSAETEQLKEYFWNDLTCILPKQEGQVAYCLVYRCQGIIGGMVSLGLTMESGDYITSCDDIVTPTDVWNEIYGKQASSSISIISRMKNTISVTEKAEIIRTLYTVILKESNRIAQDTHRNLGHIIVVPAGIATYFTLLDHFAEIPNDDRKDGFRISKFGNIGRFTIFVDKKNKTNKAVVMYRGDKPQDGAGVILDNKGIYHWFRPNGYNNYWSVIDIT